MPKFVMIVSSHFLLYSTSLLYCVVLEVAKMEDVGVGMQELLTKV